MKCQITKCSLEGECVDGISVCNSHQIRLINGEQFTIFAHFDPKDWQGVIGSRGE